MHLSCRKQNQASPTPPRQRRSTELAAGEDRRSEIPLASKVRSWRAVTRAMAGKATTATAWLRREIDEDGRDARQKTHPGPMMVGKRAGR